MATEGTKFQVNYKLADGTLINIYAATTQELESGLADLAMNAALIKSTATDLGITAGYSPAQATVISAFPGASQVQSSVIAEGSCKHGQLVYRTSKPGAPKEWKGWFCPSPQGTPDQCSPKFIR
jgi:hypothetical protein